MALLTGLKDAYYAVNTRDDSTGCTYSGPVRLPNVQQITVTPKVQSVDVAGDDVIVESVNQCLGADLSVQRSMFTPEELAILLGEKVLPNGVKVSSGNDAAPYVAFGYKRTMTKGENIYVWLLKTIFQQPAVTANTKDVNNINVQNGTITGKAITRTCDGAWKFNVSSTDPAFTASVGENWFTKATLETLATAVNTVYTNPIESVEFVTSVPATGVVGVLYVVTGGANLQTYYWDGTTMVKNGEE